MTAVIENFIEELKSRADIIDLVSEYVDLKQMGKNYRGLCPFHQEKTPSFNVNPEKKLYYCFGCGAGGDIIKFLIEIENITFQEAIKILARRVGLAIPEENQYQRELRDRRAQFFAMNHLAAKFYHYLLINEGVAAAGLKYLAARGYSQEDIKLFNLGYAPGRQSLYKFLTGKGYSAEAMIAAGLIISNNSNYYDRFRKRIIFPIFNSHGEVLAFGGRIIIKSKSSPKYLNSPETLLYKKGDNLYGMNWAREQIRKSGEVVIMEGYTDVLSSHKSGLKNTVASLGTALTNNQARLLKRYAKTVYIAYDADSAGEQATLRGLDIIKEAGLEVRVVQLPEDMDPDGLIKKEGKKGFEKLLDDSLSLLDFKIAQVIGQRDLSQTKERIDITKEIIGILAKVKDNIEREVYLQKIAQRFQFDLALLKKELIRVTENKDSKKKDKNYKTSYTKKDNETNTTRNINKIEKIILKIYIDYPEKRPFFHKCLEPGFFSDSHHDIAQLLWRHADDDIKTIISKLEDNALKKGLLALAVGEEQKILPDKIELLINQYIYLLKTRIYTDLQINKISLKHLNGLLIEFQKLSAILKEGGILDG